MNATPSSARETDTRPLLTLENVDYTMPVMPAVFAAMRKAGFRQRRRPGLRPALWGPTMSGRLGPVTAPYLLEWLNRTFRIYDQSRGRLIDAPRELASWIRTEVIAEQSGLPWLTDSMLELV